MKAIEGWKFPIDIDSKSGKIKTVCNNDAVKQSLNMILKTQIMERKIIKNYGSELKSFVFGIADSNYISSFRKSIENAINRWEPHVIGIKIDINSNSGPISKIEANIEYTTDISPGIEQVNRKISIDNI